MSAMGCLIAYHVLQPSLAGKEVPAGTTVPLSSLHPMQGLRVHLGPLSVHELSTRIYVQSCILWFEIHRTVYWNTVDT